MWALFRFLYVFLLPPVACVILSLDGSRVGAGWAVAIAMGIFVYHYVQAALIVTEKERPIRSLDLVWAIAPIILVGWANGFAWRDWIVEQMLLEAGAFSLGMASVAILKGSLEGRSAPWFLILVVFVLPALGLVWVSGRVLMRQEEHADILTAGILAIAFLLAVWDSAKRVHPYTMGSDQLVEPLNEGWHLVFVVVWLMALLIGIPWLLV